MTMQNLLVSRHAIVASMLLGVCLATLKPTTLWYNLECKVGESGKVLLYKKVELKDGSLTLDFQGKKQTFTITKSSWQSQSHVLRCLCPGEGQANVDIFAKVPKQLLAAVKTEGRRKHAICHPTQWSKKFLKNIKKGIPEAAAAAGRRRARRRA